MSIGVDSEPNFVYETLDSAWANGVQSFKIGWGDFLHMWESTQSQIIQAEEDFWNGGKYVDMSPRSQ